VNDTIHQSNGYTVHINDTIHHQGITPEEFEKDLRKHGDTSKHIYKVDTLFEKHFEKD